MEGSVSRFQCFRDPGADLAGASSEAMLRALGGPACLLFTGRDTTRTRALVTLLHGNEPSGLYALREWLLLGETPAVNLLVIVASVHAALEAPCFSHRMLPRARDLNRCFKGPFDDEQGHLAEEILRLLRQHQPEAVVDMHNTSGSGPAFGVCSHLDIQHDALVSLFTRRLVVSRLHLGALMEISDNQCPTVTVEVGGRLDEEAHDLALTGLRRYASAATVLVEDESTEWGLEVFDDPVRLELQDGVTLTYGDAPRSGYDITLRSDIEHHNFGTVTRDTHLGWITGDPLNLFKAIDSHGRCTVNALVRCHHGELYPVRSLKLFMITTNAGIAQSDCLFYAVTDDGKELLPRSV